MIKHLQKLEDEAIRFIHECVDKFDGPFLSGNSGGKDSAVLETLLQLSGIVYKSEHNITTIDPPGTIAYIKKNFPQTSFIHPKKSFYKIIEDIGLPTRRKRFCCDILKERGGAGTKTFLGVRASESHRRASMDFVNHDTRSRMKGAISFMPILMWQDQDIYNYLEWKGVELNKEYKYSKRVGCIGCPLASPKIRAEALARYPKIRAKIVKSIKIGLTNRPYSVLSVATNGNAERAMEWWMSGVPLGTYYNHFEFAKSPSGVVKALRPPIDNYHVYLGFFYSPAPHHGLGGAWSVTKEHEKDPHD